MLGGAGLLLRADRVQRMPRVAADTALPSHLSLALSPPRLLPPRQVELPSLQAGVAAAQAADVFVGLHGANLANAWLMRPGGSVLEVSPYQFGLAPGSFGLCHANAQARAGG